MSETSEMKKSMYIISKTNNGIEITTQPNKTLELWTTIETETLIDLFIQHKKDFQNAKKKKDIWLIIARTLENQGYAGKNSDRCETKWKNLVRTYRSIKDNKTVRGGPVRFPFYSKLDQAIGDMPISKRQSFFLDSSILRTSPCETSADTCEVIVKEVVCNDNQYDSDNLPTFIDDSIEHCESESMLIDEPTRQPNDTLQNSYFERKLELKERIYKLKKLKFQAKQQDRESRLEIERERVKTLKELLAVQKQLLRRI